jgi:DNA-binding IclR family transcriptional regulator
MPPTGACEGASGSIRSVVRALDALEVLAAADEIGLAEVARRLALPASTTHRLLATLAARGWVTQNPRTGRYLLSPRVLGIAARLHVRTAPLRAAARPYLERARKVSGATAQLAVLDGADVIYLEEVAAPDAGGSAAPGQTAPAHAAAAGKVLLAQAADAEPRRELERIRRRGYAVDDGELAADVACVAAPVFAASGGAVAAIGVCGAAARMRAVGLRELGEFLVIVTGELWRERGAPREPARATAHLRTGPRPRDRACGRA